MPQCTDCRRDFINLDGASCGKCRALLRVPDRSSSQFRDTRLWPQCGRCGASAVFLDVDGGACQACHQLDGEARADSANAPASAADTVYTDAVIARSHATQARLRKGITNEAAGLSSNSNPKVSLAAPTGPPNANTLASYRANGTTQNIQLAFDVRLSTAASKLDPRFGTCSQSYLVSKSMSDILMDVVESQINQVWLSEHASALLPHSEVLIRLRDNQLLHDGTRHLTAGEFYNHYLKHLPQTITKPHSKFKMSPGTKLLILELYINVEAYNRRVAEGTAFSSIGNAISVANASVARLQKRSVASSIGIKRSLPASEVVDQNATSAKRKEVRSPDRKRSKVTVGGRGLDSNSGRPGLRSSSTSKATADMESTARMVYFDKYVSSATLADLGVLQVSTERDLMDASDDFGLSAEIADLPLAQGSMKNTFGAVFKRKNYVAKQFFRLSTTGPGSRSSLSKEKNKAALEKELKRAARIACLFGEFKRVATASGVEVDHRLEISETFLAVSSDGEAWLFEPRRVASEPVKYTGTNQHVISGHSRTENTIRFFIHYAFAAANLVVADVQGSPSRLSNRTDGIILFDMMTHTVDGASGPGDHGRDGMKMFEEQHSSQCDEMCQRIQEYHKSEVEAMSSSADAEKHDEGATSEQEHPAQGWDDNLQPSSPFGDTYDGIPLAAVKKEPAEAIDLTGDD